MCANLNLREVSVLETLSCLIYRTLLGKWGWRLLSEQQSFWVKVIKEKYGVSCGGVHEWEWNKGSLGWKDIGKLEGWFCKCVKRKIARER